MHAVEAAMEGRFFAANRVEKALVGMLAGGRCTSAIPQKVKRARSQSASRRDVSPYDAEGWRHEVTPGSAYRVGAAQKAISGRVSNGSMKIGKTLAAR